MSTMTRLTHAFALLGCLLCGILVLGPVAARDISPRSLNAKRLEAVKRWESVARGRGRGASNTRRGTDNPALSRAKNITFTNPEASSAYPTVHTYPISSLMHFQSSMSMAPPFHSSTLTLARPGRVSYPSVLPQTRQERSSFTELSLASSAWPYSCFSCSSGSSLLVRKEV